MGATAAGFRRLLGWSRPHPEIAPRSAFVIVNPSALDADWRTLAIGGPSRGGTSALALVMRLAGVPFGTVAPLNHEAPEFTDLIGLSRINRAPLLREARRRDAGGRWGFKHPHAVMHLPWLEGALHAPVFLIATRNPLSVARSKITRRRDAPETFTLVAAFEQTLDFYRRLERALPRLRRPLLLVEYEKAVADPARFATELATALHLGCDGATLARMAAGITGGGYRTFESVVTPAPPA